MTKAVPGFFRVSLLLLSLISIAGCAQATAFAPSPEATTAAPAVSTATPPASASPTVSASPTTDATVAPSSTPSAASPTETPAPAATTTAVAATTPAPAGQLTVTQADNGRTIDLQPGQTFLLSLGSNLDWKVTVGDPAIVSRVVNVTVVRGAQGIYRANKPGHTTLQASGTPICQKGEMCPMFVQLVKVDLVVR